MKRCCLAVLVAVVALGCASNVDVAYPTPTSIRETGVVLVRFTEPMTSVNVRVEGMLVAEDKHTERVQITNVPTGSREVAVVASQANRKEPVRHFEQVIVDSEKPAVVLIATPPRSTGYWIQSGMTLLAYAVLFATWELR